ncbi:hypothetical protein QBC45DRAFT_473573 [Copromyces sp. CBS 386.78]|nr:hypothetical protein QBC45DRAFT_473573 [Copromyces sp. CBS 386.78]
MGSISYFTDSPPSPQPPAVIDNAQVRGYHCRALLLPWPHSLCAAILEPALLRTLLPDFAFLASHQLTSAAFPTIIHHDRLFNPSDPDPYTDPRPLHRHPNRNDALQQLSNLTQGDTVFLYLDGGPDPSHILRPGPGPGSSPRLVRVPREPGTINNDDNDNDNAYTSRIQTHRDHGTDPEEAEEEEAIRQMITHHAEQRLEITFEELIEAHEFYPFRVPEICFRLPPDGPMDSSGSRTPNDHHPHHRRGRLVDVMTVQRSRFLPSGSSDASTGMVLGVAIHSAAMDAAGVDVVMARLRTEILREVVGWE